ncbi:ABC-2 type transport system ATP-binding protein [Halovenus aranensis]|uniref:ABC-2 type transport system ATP-binding protein n=1 Tax=Halovenus aranensis TaxID=890420 RepID=A0A1G8X6G7_9EURY|nr:ABC-2 type transport system ATP-binding protein [Halovenus aranensis]
MTVTTPAVSVRGLRKDFGNGDVLAGVDLDVPDGEITLLMGPNGVGKTILLSCIAGGLHPDDGEVTVFGASPGAAAESLSFMLQDAMLVDELTGRENVAFFRDLHPHSTDEVEAILETLDFETEALEMEVGDYSGGMKRKLELAISLSVDVSLYLLDEPTAALDMTTVEQLHSLLADRREAGETILVSSHLPADAELADTIAVVTDDGVTAVDSPEALLAAVPPVVLAEGPADIADAVRDGRLFEGEIHRRGFLREGVDPERVTGDEGTAVQVREPTYTDMFNYYVHLRGTR